MKRLILVFIIALTLGAFASCGECEHQWKEASCEKAKECSLCGETSGSPLEHSWISASCESAEKCAFCGKSNGAPLGHSWVEASCDAPKSCQICNKTEGEKLPHSWSDAKCTFAPVCTACGEIGKTVEHTWVDASCESARYCSACGEAVGDALGHSWVQTSCALPRECSVCHSTTYEGIEHNWVFVKCTEPRACGDCGTVEASAKGHQYTEATCTMPSRCSVCKQGKGAPLGHNWVEASCTMAKHCSRCLLTQGEPIGHVWTVVESIKPSCSEGREVSRCVCGEESIVTTPSILGFHYCDSNGYCSVCNNTYDPSKMTLDEIVVNASHTVKCGVFSTPETRTSVYRPITPGDVNIPIVDLNGNLSSVTTGTYIDIPFSYADGDFTFDCIASIRIQGASSTGYPKKNYSIKLYEADGTKNKVKLREDWTKEFKYCLKANWVDYSQARNVVSGQLYGDVIRARDIEDELSGLVNGGAIDGFPVLVFNNGAFHGLYTLNIPKDKWMFDMKDSDEKNQAIVMGEHWGNSVAMRELISYSPNTTTWTHMSKWELEFASNEESLVDNSTVWVLESLNNLIRFVMNNNGEDFKNGISQYADVDKCIDSMLYTFFICADDNISKNILWVTYDGTHWFSSVYDMDGTWGLQWNGNLTFKDANTHLINILENHNNSNYNLLWEKLYLNFYDKIVERYWELRASVFNMEHITSRFEAFFNSIPDYVREAEREKWTGVPSQTTNNLEQILDFAKKRIEKMDAILVPKN